MPGVPKGRVKPWGKLTQKWLLIWKAADGQVQAWHHGNLEPQG